MKRFQSRGGGGRFRRNTMENTFGLHVPACPHCRRFNPYSVGEKKPENCHACGKPLDASAVVSLDRPETQEDRA